MLPKTGAPALPVETVNTETLDLTLFRVSDRNLLRAVQNSYLDMPIAQYDEYNFEGSVGEELWKGSAKVAMQVNKDVTTRLPMAEPLKDLPAGIYALKAAVPGLILTQCPRAGNGLSCRIWG